MWNRDTDVCWPRPACLLRSAIASNAHLRYSHWAPTPRYYLHTCPPPLCLLMPPAVSHGRQVPPNTTPPSPSLADDEPRLLRRHVYRGAARLRHALRLPPPRHGSLLLDGCRLLGCSRLFWPAVRPNARHHRRFAAGTPACRFCATRHRGLRSAHHNTLRDGAWACHATLRHYRAFLNILA